MSEPRPPCTDAHRRTHAHTDAHAQPPFSITRPIPHATVAFFLSSSASLLFFARGRSSGGAGRQTERPRFLPPPLSLSSYLCPGARASSFSLSYQRSTARAVLSGVCVISEASALFCLSLSFRLLKFSSRGGSGARGGSSLGLVLPRTRWFTLSICSEHTRSELEHRRHHQRTCRHTHTHALTRDRHTFPFRCGSLKNHGVGLRGGLLREPRRAARLAQLRAGPAPAKGRGDGQRGDCVPGERSRF